MTDEHKLLSAAEWAEAELAEIPHLRNDITTLRDEGARAIIALEVERDEARRQRDEARAKYSAQGTALLAAIQAINDAEILMPDKVLDFTSGNFIPDRRWRPISEAPRDGTHILAWNGNRTGHHFDSHPPTVVHWFEDGFYPSVSEIGNQPAYQATVWTTLDERPAIDAAQAECERLFDV